MTIDRTPDEQTIDQRIAALPRSAFRGIGQEAIAAMLAAGATDPAVQLVEKMERQQARKARKLMEQVA